MQEHFSGVWGAMARIPDNPEVRSKQRFSFKEDLDALTFGWQAACAVLRVLRLVANEVQRQPAAV